MRGIIDIVRSMINKVWDRGETPETLYLSDRDKEDLVVEMQALGECVTIYNIEKRLEKIMGVNIEFGNNDLSLSSSCKTIVLGNQTVDGHIACSGVYNDNSICGKGE